MSSLVKSDWEILRIFHRVITLYAQSLASSVALCPNVVLAVVTWAVTAGERGRGLTGVERAVLAADEERELLRPGDFLSVSSSSFSRRNSSGTTNSDLGKPRKMNWFPCKIFCKNVLCLYSELTASKIVSHYTWNIFSCWWSSVPNIWKESIQYCICYRADITAYILN